MKTKIVIIAMICFIAGSIQSLSAQTMNHDMHGHKDTKSSIVQPAKTPVSAADSIKVSGNCGMCKKRIEKAAMSVPGVKSANWDSDTKILVVTYAKESKSDEVQKAIAKVGHDTPKYKSTKAVYDDLPGCCQYRD